MTDTVTDTAADNLLLRILLDPESRRDPYPLYQELRELAPVLRSSMGALVLSRYDDCAAVLRDPRSSSDPRTSIYFEAFMAGRAEEEVLGDLANFRPFLFMDPPDHTRLRGLVSKAFTPKVVEQLRRTDRFVIEHLEHIPQDDAGPVGFDRVRHDDAGQDPFAERDPDAGAGRRQRQRLPPARGEAQRRVLQLGLGGRQRHGELAQHLGVRVKRVARLAPLLVGQGRPPAGHGHTLTVARCAALLSRRRRRRRAPSTAREPVLAYSHLKLYRSLI